MRVVERAALIAQPAATVYGLINDIESYPKFVPGCVRARIETRTQTEIVATLGVKRGPLALDFTTRNTLTPHSAIDMQLVSGPFSTLAGGWQLTALSEAGCRATLRLQFAFSNRATGLLLEPLFASTVQALVDAFVARARGLPKASPAT
jgi:ribosome-associated toxin RatA of RatAB toxin-antitoxin module